MIGTWWFTHTITPIDNSEIGALTACYCSRVYGAYSQTIKTIKYERTSHSLDYGTHFRFAFIVPFFRCRLIHFGKFVRPPNLSALIVKCICALCVRVSTEAFCMVTRRRIGKFSQMFVFLFGTISTPPHTHTYSHPAVRENNPYICREWILYDFFTVCQIGHLCTEESWFSRFFTSSDMRHIVEWLLLDGLCTTDILKSIFCWVKRLHGTFVCCDKRIYQERLDGWQLSCWAVDWTHWPCPNIWSIRFIWFVLSVCFLYSEKWKIVFFRQNSEMRGTAWFMIYSSKNKFVRTKCEHDAQHQNAPIQFVQLNAYNRATSRLHCGHIWGRLEFISNFAVPAVDITSNT